MRVTGFEVKRAGKQFVAFAVSVRKGTRACLLQGMGVRLGLR